LFGGIPFGILRGGELPKIVDRPDITGTLEKDGYLSVPLHPAKTAFLHVNVRVNNERHVLIVDSGWTRTGIGASQAKKLGLEWIKTGATSITQTGDHPACYCEIDNLEIGTFKTGRRSISNVHASLIDHDQHVDGLLGADLLVAHQAIVDFGKRKLYLRQSLTEKPTKDKSKSLFHANDYVSIPLKRMSSGHIAVGVRLADRRLFLLVDTAAQRCTFIQARTKGLGLQWNTYQGPERQRGNADWEWCHIDGLEIGSVKSSPLKIWNDLLTTEFNRLSETTGDPLCDGILGGGGLERHQAVIDYSSNTLFLRKTINSKVAEMLQADSIPKRDVTAPTGRILLVNHYSESLAFRINGHEHLVQSGKSMVVEAVPTGDFAYEVSSSRWGLLRRETAALRSGETFTIRASKD